jgi:nicotinate phosphoribosyltransferase
MLTDLYQLTMMYGYFKKGMHESIAVFDMFFRRSVGDSTYAVMAGLEQLIEIINDLHFAEEDIDYLRSLNLFDEDFFEYLQNMRFDGEIYAIPEGTVVFPGEPLVRVKAKIILAQLIETVLLNLINHQTLIATKASRIVHAADGDVVLEFGLRRAQGPDAGVYGARAAIIGGCDSTSNVLTAQYFGGAPKGTHAHSWIMSFDSELEAFRAYAEVFPDSCMLLVDTYDTLRSGMPNAITVFKELRAAGHKPAGIRLDSGDIAYLSKRARQMLDEEGFTDVPICASGDLDEYLIRELKQQGARVNIWGVGTKLITSEDYPALGGVYKLVAVERHGILEPRIKISENIEKITTPAYKKVVRIYDNATHKAIADLIMLEEEEIDETEPLIIFSPTETWKRSTLTNYYVKDLLQPIFVEGKQVYTSPSMLEIRDYAKEDLATFWEEYKRFVRPHIYKVDLSQKLYDLKHEMIIEGKHE